MTAYLGIDRSNHGGKPFEIFTALYSDDDKDICEHLSLRKDRSKTPLIELLGGREFRYIRIPQDVKLFVGEFGIQMITTAAFIRHFEKNSKGLAHVVVNGELDQKVIEEAKRAARYSTPTLTGESEADIRFPIVNVADSLANSLLKYYKSGRKGYNPSRFELKPNIRDYEEALRRLRREPAQINGMSKGFINRVPPRLAYSSRGMSLN